MDTKIEIQQLFKFRKSWMKKKAHRVVILMNEVINSDEFRDRVNGFDFKDRRYKASPTSEVREITDNKEIYELLKKGNEQYSDSGNDYLWRLKIKLGRGLRQVGRREKDLIITQNWFLKRSNNDHSVAAHWFHEYCHVLGFMHDYKDTDIRPFSIPYAVGDIVEDLLK